MTASSETDHRFVAYEYITIPARPDQESLLKDAYHSLGWACEAVERSSLPGAGVSLRLKRDRALPNKPALAKLQRQLEARLEAIDGLSRSKTSRATIVSMSVGILGTAALGGSVFCFMAGLWLPFVLLGVVGLIGWVLPYFVFLRIKADRTTVANEAIEHQYDQLYEVCEQAAALSSSHLYQSPDAREGGELI